MTEEEKAMILAAQAEPEQFTLLYKTYYRRVFNYFWYRVGHDEAVAEDLTQDTFVRAYKALPNYTITEASYFAYLLRIAHNLLVNHYRRPAPLSIEEYDIDVPQEIWREVEAKDMVRSVWRAVQSLSQNEQDILYLKYRRGRPVKEIADIVGKSENAVKLTLSRARKKLSNHPYVADVIGTFADQPRRLRKARFLQS